MGLKPDLELVPVGVAAQAGKEDPAAHRRAQVLKPVVAPSCGFLNHRPGHYRFTRLKPDIFKFLDFFIFKYLASNFEFNGMAITII